MLIQSILSVTFILFTVIDIPGSLPVIISMKKEGTEIQPLLATLAAGIIMVCFYFGGASVLQLLGVEMSSFAIAGSLIIFFIGLEMVLGIRFFRESHDSPGSGSIVPIAFPLVAGAGTLTTLISLKADYDTVSIFIAVLLNLAIVYLVLKSSGWLSRKISAQAMTNLRKIFGVLLLAIAVQMFISNIILLLA